MTATGLLRDSGGAKLRKVDPLRDRQDRFLGAYRERLCIAAAARLAHVHRGTIYRWLVDGAFRQEMNDAAELFFRNHRAKLEAEEAVRREWRKMRERERRPMRCHYLARARAAKH